MRRRRAAGVGGGVIRSGVSGGREGEGADS